MKKESIKQEVVPIPGSVKEAVEFLGKIGNFQRQIARIDNVYNNSVEKLRKRATEKTIPRQEEINRLFEGLFIFGQAHREELTEEEKKKTIQWPTGQIGWKLNPPSVSIKGEKNVIAVCKNLGLTEFIRTKEEVNREEMLKQPEVAKNIPGVTIEKKENFFAKPAKLQIEISKAVKLPKKQIPQMAKK